MAGPSGLHNVQVAGIPMPAPMFGFMHRARAANQASREENKEGGVGGIEEQKREAEEIGPRIESLMRNFMNLFSGNNQFMRMQMQYEEFSPNNFMSNFQQNFASDDIFEMIRRISE